MTASDELRERVARALNDLDCAGLPVISEPGEMGSTLSYETDWSLVADAVLSAISQRTDRPLRLRGQHVEVWHPASPGIRVTVWRSWWRRKTPLFASPNEVQRSRRPTYSGITNNTKRGAS